MKRTAFFILALSISIFSISCTPFWVKKEFKYCFDGKKTGLDTLINIKGAYAYYTIMRKKNDVLPVDTLSPAFVFYDNGFVEVNVNIRDNERTFLTKRFGDYGTYIIHSDTIKLQYVTAPGRMYRSVTEIWFKIIDKNTLQRIDTADRPLQPFAERIYIFRPLEIKVKPEDTWIYNKEWFRCKKK